MKNNQFIKIESEGRVKGRAKSHHGFRMPSKTCKYVISLMSITHILNNNNNNNNSYIEAVFIHLYAYVSPIFTEVI